MAGKPGPRPCGASDFRTSEVLQRGVGDAGDRIPWADPRIERQSLCLALLLWAALEIYGIRYTDLLPRFQTTSRSLTI